MRYGAAANARLLVFLDDDRVARSLATRGALKREIRRTDSRDQACATKQPILIAQKIGRDRLVRRGQPDGRWGLMLNSGGGPPA